MEIMRLDAVLAIEVASKWRPFSHPHATRALFPRRTCSHD